MLKKIIKTIITLTILLNINFTFNKEVKANNLTLKVKQHIITNYSKPNDNFTYLMKGEKSSPLPSDNFDNYIFNLKGDEEKDLNIEYKNSGKYYYTIYQITNENENLKLDKSVYNIEVEVVRTAKGLEVSNYTIYLNNKKAGEIDFINEYNMKPKELAKKLGLLTKTGLIEKTFVMFISSLFIILILVILKRKEKKL